MEELDANMEQKDGLIQKLTALDDGFETLYERVKEQLSTNKDAYKNQIKRIQELITKVTEKVSPFRLRKAGIKSWSRNISQRKSMK